MDKRTLSAFILIGLIIFVWSFFLAPTPTTKPAGADSTAHAPQVVDTSGLHKSAAPPPTATFAGTPFAPLAAGNQRFITIETPLYKAIINTRGALLARFELKKYRTWYGAPVQLITDSTGFPGELGLSFVTPAGKLITTDQLVFSSDAPSTITVGEHDSVVLTARLMLGGQAAAADSAADSTAAPGSPSTTTPAATSAKGIEKRFVFRGDSYGVGLDVAMQNMADEIGRGSYSITWRRGLKYQEHNSVDESQKAKALVAANGEITDVDNNSIGTSKKESFNGNVDWVGVKSKYFGAALIPSKTIAGGSVAVVGTAAAADSSGHVESYDITVNVPYKSPSESRHFTVFLGPLEYDIASHFGLTAMLDFGARFVVRPIGEFFMLPFFRLLHTFIGNYGVVILVFSLVIRLLLWPLSIPQIKSSRKMQLLQPKIAEIRERNADDQQAQQMETMKLYREYGVNPVGGCLPLVLQLPILYALWGTLSSAIELRQANFAFWIHDLSIPDVVFNLPFSLPLLGNQLSGLALIMGATLLVQQQMMVTDPKQKAMVYLMPILLTLMFNHFPSGLNLYYLTFNLLSIGQQVYMTKFAKSKLTLEDMRTEASKKKKGWLSQKMEEAQKMAEMQGKGMPGQGQGKGRAVDGRTPVEPRKNKKS